MNIFAKEYEAYRPTNKFVDKTQWLSYILLCVCMKKSFQVKYEMADVLWRGVSKQDSKDCRITRRHCLTRVGDAPLMQPCLHDNYLNEYQIIKFCGLSLQSSQGINEG